LRITRLQRAAIFLTAIVIHREREALETKRGLATPEAPCAGMKEPECGSENGTEAIDLTRLTKCLRQA
jgi:hypothetical protein